MKGAAAVFVLVLFASLGCAAEGGVRPTAVSPEDRDPIDGMFVIKYPDWKAEIVFKDGSAVKFMCPKHLLEYYNNANFFLGREHVEYVESYDAIAAIFVTDHATKGWIDAVSAYYVAGSDVMSPMGPDLIPFSREGAAQRFAAEHQGRVLRFKDVGRDLLMELEAGKRPMEHGMAGMEG